MRARAGLPSKDQELCEDKPLPKRPGRKGSESEEWRGPKRGGKEREELGPQMGWVQPRTMYLPRTDRWAVKETERTDQRQTGRQRARELSLEARVVGDA